MDVFEGVPGVPTNGHDSRETRRLLADIGTGDEAGLDQLLTRHRAYLRRFVELRMDPRLRQRVDPSDVVQEAQLEAARRFSTYAEDPPMPFRLWLRQITYDRLLMLQRRHAGTQRRDLAREAVLSAESGMMLARQVGASAATPSQVLIRGEMVRRVQEAIGRMSPDDREILLMRAIEGLSNIEAAAVLSVTPDAASKRYGRALLRLRSTLAGAGSAEADRDA
jgi:RNA polymerase sigma-70 factor (ECF subfamily)